MIVYNAVRFILNHVKAAKKYDTEYGQQKQNKNIEGENRGIFKDWKYDRDA